MIIVSVKNNLLVGQAAVFVDHNPIVSDVISVKRVRKLKFKLPIGTRGNFISIQNPLIIHSFNLIAGKRACPSVTTVVPNIVPVWRENTQCKTRPDHSRINSTGIATYM